MTAGKTAGDVKREVGGGEGGEVALGKDKQHSTDRNKSREEPGKGSLPKRAHLIQEPRAATEQK